MAHFAELDENNTVVRVVVVSNEETHDANGVEDEELGIAFCRRLFGLNTKWKQTSYNGSIRSRYASIGSIYHSQLDVFIDPKPYVSWVLNENTASWEAPIPKPELTPIEIEQGKIYEWDEETVDWVLVKNPQFVPGA